MPRPVHSGSRRGADVESLLLGDLVITAHATPGHTRGNTTWTWTSCKNTRCLDVVNVGSLSAPGFMLAGNPDYPDVVEDFRASFAKVAALPCDIALAPHPGMVDFRARVERRDPGDAGALIDGTLCRAYAGHARRALEGELAGPVS